MKNLILLSVILPFAGMAQNFDYLPAPVGNHQILTYSQFTVSYNEEHEQADWVAYELTKAEAEMDRDRCDCFARDTNVSTGSAVDGDYSSTGFDRGHLSPAADNNASAQANEESFLFSNMSPQLPYFNREVWVKLESWVRQKAIDLGTVYVTTGPIFVNNLGKIGNNEVTIPGYYYKVLLTFRDNGNPSLIGFLLPHVLPASADFRDFVVPVNTIETLTGLDFFPALDNNVEGRNEATVSNNFWGL
ncbi:MAG: DNA/RNA non-specific endonuclease [Bacteroidota bacterium]